MIILDATTKSLQLKLGATVATNQLPFSASYVDSTGTTTTPGENDNTSNNTTAVNLIASPAASTQRLIKNIVIQNADTASAKVSVIYNNNSTLRNIVIATLAVGDQLIYEDGSGWSTIDTNGNLKTSANGGGGGGSGTVTTVSVVSANGFTGTVATATTTPAITMATSVTGVLKGNGTAISAATAGTDYQAPITLTTTGSSGPATFVSNTLNIPQYTGGGGGTVVYNAIAGCLPSSITGTNTTAAMTVGTGQAADSTNAVYLTSAGYSWAVSNGNAINGYQGGATLPNSSTIHFFICSGGSGTGTFASTSLSPTLPSGYSTYYRRTYSLNTNSSGAPIPYTAIEAEGGSYEAWLATQVLDIASSTTTTSSRTLYSLTVPSGIKVKPEFRANSTSSSLTVGIILTSGDETDVAPAVGVGQTWTSLPGSDSTMASAGSFVSINSGLTTNTSGQIGARSNNTAAGIYWVTRGFKDWRRS